MPEIHRDFTLVKDLAKKFVKEKREVPTVTMGILLKNERLLDGITPLAIRQYESKRPPKRRLMLLYIDQAGLRKRIRLEKLKGIDVAKGSGKYSGKLLVQFTYYKPSSEVGNSGKLEEAPRRVFAKDHAYGLHKTHEKHGEVQDFYLVGVDVNKITEVDDGKRVFPFWRIFGMYGEPSEIAKEFKKNSR